MSLENVRAFYEKLANDDNFRSQIESVKSKEQCSKIVKAAGYYFTQEEYEEYTLELLEAANSEGEIEDLNDKELAGVVGGITGSKFWFPQPLYGVVWPPIQQTYGVIRVDEIDYLA